MNKRISERNSFIRKIKRKFHFELPAVHFYEKNQSEDKKKRIKLRKNYFPMLILIVGIWSGIAGIIYFTDPDSFGIIPLFLLSVFTALFLTNTIIFTNKRRGFLLSAVITSYLLLKYYGAGSFLNLMLLFGLAICAELFLSRN